MMSSAHPRIRIVHLHTSDEFRGRYKGHEVSVERDLDRGDWYCTVTHPDGGLLCDGWMGGCSTTVEQAVALAMTGACLLEAA